MAKATEVPSTTKPVGKPGDERTYTRKDRSVREHPFKDQGYKGVGSKAKETKGDGSERTAPAKKDCCRPHPHAGSAKGKDGADARKVAPAPKSPFRNA